MKNLGKEELELPEQSKLPSREEAEKRSVARDRRSRQQLPALFGLAVLCVNTRTADDIPAILPQAIVAVLDLVLIYWLATRYR